MRNKKCAYFVLFFVPIHSYAKDKAPYFFRQINLITEEIHVPVYAVFLYTREK